jgi:prolyl-tRNA editing enzyme YbaK/EbsC (Cys-tRNA(Pro) deacylase)
VPPFGHSTQLRVFVDSDLLQYDDEWAAAGTWNDNFGAAPADIVRVAGGVVTDLRHDLGVRAQSGSYGA